jgi:hypothetical protein
MVGVTGSIPVVPTIAEMPKALRLSAIRPRLLRSGERPILRLVEFFMANIRRQLAGLHSVPVLGQYLNYSVGAKDVL